MRISYVYEGALPSRQAAFIQILNTARALATRGVLVSVVILDKGGDTVPDPEDCLAYYGLRPHPKLDLMILPWGGWHRLARYGRLYQLTHPDGGRGQHVIISRGEPGLNLFRRLRWLPRPPGQRHVYEAHRLCFTKVGQWFQPSGPLAAWRLARAEARTFDDEKRAVETADGVICLTPGVKGALAQHFGDRVPTLILPSGTDSPPPEVPGDAERDIEVFYAGKLTARKGVYDLVKAMAYLQGVHCYLAGGGRADIEAVEKVAEQLEVADRVHLLGYVSPGKIRDLYLRAKVGVCPLPAGISTISEQYTSPLKVLQMMACGVPVVATQLPAMGTLLQHEQTGLLAQANDPRDLARTIRRVLEDRALARRLAEAARAEVVRYTWAERARHLHAFTLSLYGKEG